MRLVTYKAGGSWRAGILLEGAVVDSAAAAQEAGLLTEGGVTDWTSNRSVVAAGEERLRKLETGAGRLLEIGEHVDVHAQDAVRLGPPIVDPEKIVCLGLNYAEHATESAMEAPEAPMLFAKYRNSLVGQDAPVVLPRASEKVDYEGELAVVIGRRCKDVPEDEALDHVAGYMPLNDVSARDLQKQTSQWLAGKAVDTFAPCGPALVTVDEVGDVQELGISTRVNGETVQDANTSMMIFPVAQTIAFVSRIMTLEPGDIIATGTPSGVGQSRNPPLFLKAGDVVEVEVESLGVLRNPIVGADGSDAVATRGGGRTAVDRERVG